MFVCVLLYIYTVLRTVLFALLTWSRKNSCKFTVRGREYARLVFQIARVWGEKARTPPSLFIFEKGGNDQNMPLTWTWTRSVIYRITIGRELQTDQVRSDRHAPQPLSMYINVHTACTECNNHSFSSRARVCTLNDGAGAAVVSMGRWILTNVSKLSFFFAARHLDQCIAKENPSFLIIQIITYR